MDSPELTVRQSAGTTTRRRFAGRVETGAPQKMCRSGFTCSAPGCMGSTYKESRNGQYHRIEERDASCWAENKSRKTSDAQGPVVVIFLGPPGCGKGTQSRELSRTIGLAHVSTGELLRRAAREGSALGQMVHGKIPQASLCPTTWFASW